MKKQGNKRNSMKENKKNHRNENHNTTQKGGEKLKKWMMN